MILYDKDIIFTGTFNTRIGVSSFNQIPVLAFSCRDNRKIPEYFLLCLLLCQSWLFKIYECNCQNSTAPYSGTAADFLRMAGKSTIEPDWQWVVSIYPTFSLFMQWVIYKVVKWCKITKRFVNSRKSVATILHIILVEHN